ncbi:hypothetical protein BDV98DRAFT_594397 [Pterulicium gracile]|uniref:Saccharopine dehydrogenase NADP binding domain-containing protein n=1 Tax=Pterulicium gracile TaxID=1884261 RepID=A0A5C3QCN3_9AGAR|nr:hypothetical protein BDV98DRAFT_594397 [Pterula gracilis]
MSEFNSYAVLGAGLVGNAFITALLTTKPNASIVILSRSATKSSTLPAEIANNPHIKTVVVDYSSVSSVSTALKEHAIEVVVDTVQIYDEAFDNPLADAAKEAGTLKLFVPSEFGFVSENATMYPLNTKGATQEHVKSIGLPFVVINLTRSWASFISSGDVVFSATAVVDIAGFLVHLLTKYPCSKLEFTTYRIQGSRLTLKEAAAKFKLPIVFASSVPVPDEDDRNRRTLLQNVIESGKASVGWDHAKEEDSDSLAGSGNAAWEGHVWKTVKEVHNL